MEKKKEKEVTQVEVKRCVECGGSLKDKEQSPSHDLCWDCWHDMLEAGLL